MIFDSTFLAVEKALIDRVHFHILPVTGISRIEKFDFIGHFFCCYKKQWQEEISLENAVWFKDLLKSSPYQKNEEFDPERLSSAVRLFLDQYKTYKTSPAYKDCALEFLAYRLKIPSNSLDDAVNPGFREFAEKSHLYNYLATHNHSLLVDANDKIQIMSQGEYQRWEIIKPIVDDYLKELEKLQEPYTISLYGHQGIEYRNRCTWTKLKAFLKGDTNNWASHFLKSLPVIENESKTYAIEFCSTATEKTPRKVGDHTFLRLYSFKKENEKTIGKMYSLGLYRPHKERHQSLRDAPFKIKKGFINEDVSEVWGINDKIRTIAGRITQEQFFKIKDKIEQDKRKDEIKFQLLSLNCDQYASDLSLLAGIKLPTKRHFFELLVVSFAEENFKNSKRYVQIAAYIANLLLKGFLFLCTPLFNAILLYGGAGLVDSRVKGSPKPLISSFFDLFDQKTLYPSSPWILGHVVKKEVEEWRKMEIAKLDLTKKENKRITKEILFSFPPHYKT